MGVNKVILVGNVGKDPEVRHLDNDLVVANFPLATSETFKRNGEKITNTEWHNITLWRGLAQVAENYVKKGSQLYIEGRIRTRSYDDKDGNKRYITEIIGDNMQMLDRKGDNNNDNSNYNKSAQQTTPEVNESMDAGQEVDDLPF